MVQSSSQNWINDNSKITMFQRFLGIKIVLQLSFNYKIKGEERKDQNIYINLKHSNIQVQ